MSSEKSGSVQLSITNVYGEFINEPADIQLRHQTLSEQVDLRGVLAKSPIVVKGLRSNPIGIYRAFIDAPSYLPSAFIVSIPSSGILDKSVPLAVDFRKVTRVKFPDWPAFPLVENCWNEANPSSASSTSRGRHFTPPLTMCGEPDC